MHSSVCLTGPRVLSASHTLTIITQRKPRCLGDASLSGTNWACLPAVSPRLWAPHCSQGALGRDPGYRRDHWGALQSAEGRNECKGPAHRKATGPRQATAPKLLCGATAESLPVPQTCGSSHGGSWPGRGRRPEGRHTPAFQRSCTDLCGVRTCLAPLPPPHITSLLDPLLHRACPPHTQATAAHHPPTISL